MSRGALVVIEGIDRCGKTTQTIKLVDSLKKKNITAERMAFPDRTTWTGQVISKYLSDKECKLNDQAIHLLFTANRWENVDRIKKQIAKGTTLIVDRYSYSGVAFSTAKGMELNWCMQPEIGLPKPDLVVFLNVTPETQENRPGFGAERYETTTIQNKVRKIFEQFAKLEDHWQVVDANDNFDKVHSKLLNSIEDKIAKIKKENTPLQFINNDEKENFYKINVLQNSLKA